MTSLDPILDRAFISDDHIGLNDLEFGRARLVHPNDVAVLRRTDDDTIIGYVVRTDFVGEVSAHPFVAEQPARNACLLFVGPNRVCGRTADDPLHRYPLGTGPDEAAAIEDQNG